MYLREAVSATGPSWFLSTSEPPLPGRLAFMYQRTEDRMPPCLCTQTVKQRPSECKAHTKENSSAVKTM